MVVFGGLEFVVGGYLVHRHYKNKNEKKKLEAETDQRRHNTFPGAKPQASCPSYQQQQHVVIPQQKYAHYAPQIPQQHHQFHQQPQPQYPPQPRPQHLPHTQSFNIPRRPLPHQQLPQIIQPLQRADSFATISRMSIADGYRPSGVEGETPTLPPQRQTSNLWPIPQSPYSNAGFSVSTPALGPAPITPTTPIYGTGQQGGRQTIDDNWETYGRQPGHAQYAPSVSTALGENDPPPPYMP